MRTVLLLAAATLVLAAPARADPAGAPCPELTPANQWKPGYSAHLDVGLRPASSKTRALLVLAHDGLTLRNEDGGSLSPAHRAELQARLNAIQSGRY